MRVYLDYNATTPPFPEVWDRLLSLRHEPWCNPSSIHQEGRKTKHLLDQARLAVAKILGAQPWEVMFTSGGTEANATALWGWVRELGGPAGVTLYLGATEHPSVFANAEVLRQLGSRVEILPVDEQGLIQVSFLAQCLPPALVVVQLANHETGVLQPIREMVRQVAQPQVRFHCDAVQAVGKVPVSFAELGVDSLSLSGHKLGGFPGAGALLVKGGRPLPALVAGEQERRGRGGTEPVVAICTLGWACDLLAQRQDQWMNVARLRDELEQQLLKRGLGERIFARQAPRVPNTTCVALPPPLTGSVAVAALDLQGFAVSSGPACSSGASLESAVVRAMGFGEQAGRTLRVSLGLSTTSEELGAFLAALEHLVFGGSKRP